MINIALKKWPIYRWFTYVLKMVTWWFSMGMLNNQMVTTSDCHQIVFADWLVMFWNPQCDVLDSG